MTRRAKYILIHLDDAQVLIIHLGMSGRIHIHDNNKKFEKQKHDHFLMTLSNGRVVVFNDPRRFGLIAFVEEKNLEAHALFSHLGPEPFAKEFDATFLGDAFKNRKTSIKVALMDQTLVVGVGNIYASEALFDAGIDPRLKASDVQPERLKLLVTSIRKVLKAAIKAGGSTLKDYRKVNGDLGYFQHKFTVYDRGGKACGKCTCDVTKTGGVQKLVQGGRSTFYCSRKQI